MTFILQTMYLNWCNLVGFPTHDTKNATCGQARLNFILSNNNTNDNNHYTLD